MTEHTSKMDQVILDYSYNFDYGLFILQCIKELAHKIERIEKRLNDIGKEEELY